MPTRSFDPIKTNVLSVLENHLSVPKYQRPYTWKPENIDILWEDIISQNGLNFFGIIVLHDNGARDSSGTRRIQIIDGQQRLTTITILLALLRNLANAINDTELAAETHMAIEKSNALGSKGFILAGSSSLHDFLSRSIQSKESLHDNLFRLQLSQLSAEEEKVVKNYRKAHELLTSAAEWQEGVESQSLYLKSIKEKLLETELIQVTVNSEDDAYDLFETLNSRSVSLSEVNMIKNRIFMMLSSQLTDSELENRWSLIESNAGGDRKKPEEIQKFINYFWWSRYSKIPPKQIFRELRNINTLYIFEQFENDSKVYGKIRSQDSSQLITYRHIDLTSICTLAQLLNLQQVYIPLLSLARKFTLPNDEFWNDFNNKGVVPFIKKLEKFIFAYKFSPRSPARVERLYSRGAIGIFESKNRTELNNSLLAFEADINNNFPTEQEFKDSLRKLKYVPGSGANNRIIAYLLSSVLYGDNREIVIGEADIEHIFPRNPTGGFGIDEKDIEVLLNSLGNLTPLSEDINRRQCQNKRPADKTEFYNKSAISTNHDIAQHIDARGWTAEDINNRTEILINAMWDYVKP